jgi:hypothetical protein
LIVLNLQHICGFFFPSCNLVVKEKIKQLPMKHEILEAKKFVKYEIYVWKEICDQCLKMHLLIACPTSTLI